MYSNIRNSELTKRVYAYIYIYIYIYMNTYTHTHMYMPRATGTWAIRPAVRVRVSQTTLTSSTTATCSTRANCHPFRRDDTSGIPRRRPPSLSQGLPTLSPRSLRGNKTTWIVVPGLSLQFLVCLFMYVKTCWDLSPSPQIRIPNFHPSFHPLSPRK